jgi:MoCo/4Fe-4S cofactor protein with predicted Tat translocation signal
MKTPPFPVASAATGREYWRSLDQLTESPEFRRWLASEFPEDFPEPGDTVSRRHFVKIMAASFLLAGVGLTGCRKPEEYIYPFGKMPPDYTHGSPQYYATAMPTRTGAIPLLAKSNDGRPTKIEGNPRHPASQGGTDVFSQASLLNLYDPDRAARILQHTTEETPAAAHDFLARLARVATDKKGQGLCFLSERHSSPSRARLQGLIREKLPQARWFV